MKRYFQFFLVLFAYADDDAHIPLRRGDLSVLFGFILRGSPIGEWGLQFFEFILSVIIFLFVVLFKLYLLLFS